MSTLDIILKSLAAYRIHESQIELTDTVLGRGGSGLVLLGSLQKSKSGRLVAVKQLHATGTVEENEDLALALAQELHVWAGLAHPNVVPLVGFFLDEGSGVAWLISTYLKNGNILKYLDQHQPDMVIRLRMLGEVAKGIAYLHHRNLCHGDIKGANVLVDDSGQAKICDFGLTKLLESGTIGGMTSTRPKGTIRYMAPEFFHNERPARTKQTDVWAWSCLGLEVLFGRPPYDGLRMPGTIILQIVQGVLPLNLDMVDIDEKIKQLFWSCWVADPLARINMQDCVRSVDSVLRKMQGQVGDKPDEQASTDQAIHSLEVPSSESPTKEHPPEELGAANPEPVDLSEMPNGLEHLGISVPEEREGQGRNHVGPSSIIPPTEDLGGEITFSSIEPFDTRGHFCDLILAEHRTVGKVALKRLRHRDGDIETLTRQCKREKDLWMGLRHDRILKCLGSFTREGELYLVSPFMKNGSLFDWVRSKPHVGLERLRLVYELANALAYLHASGIVHGDIKSNNVLLCDDMHVQLCDFGLTKLVETATSVTLKSAGTTRWQGPELWDDAPKNLQSDTYAFAMTIVEILTGEIPFATISNPFAVIKAVSVHGIRPIRSPEISPDGKSYANTWDVAAGCWHGDPNQRLSMAEAAGLLALSTGSY